jgi:hypothetical protein
VVDVSRVPGMATFGFLLSPSAVEYLTLEERKAIVDPISAALRDKRVADFMRADPVVVARRIGWGAALKTLKQAAASLLPVVDKAQRCKGWLRLEFVVDLLHQGKARVQSPVHHLLIYRSSASNRMSGWSKRCCVLPKPPIGNLPSRMGRVN